MLALTTQRILIKMSFWYDKLQVYLSRFRFNGSGVQFPMLRSAGDKFKPGE
ncbi:MAG: hypothetical protein ACD_39C01144G0002 [uncultured bacterium]|nr:MAG: hypothetical protein ACD_39C01144G0002 [uncultured bacterium]